MRFSWLLLVTACTSTPPGGKPDENGPPAASTAAPAARVPLDAGVASEPAGSPPPTTTPTSKTCEPGLKRSLGQGVKTYPREPTREEQSAWKLSPALDVQTVVARQADRLVVTATLKNTDSKPHDFIYWPGATLKATNPLRVSVPATRKPGPASRAEHGTHLLTLAPGSAAVFEVTLCQDEFTAPWPTPMRVSWTLAGLHEGESRSGVTER